MNSLRSGRIRFTAWAVAAILVGLLTGKPALAQSGNGSSLIIYVREASNEHPIFQARLTLQFNKHGGRLKKRGLIEYSAKTNPQGRYRFTDIPLGTIRLIVTATDHQTFSQEFQLTKTNQVINVKLKAPHPLL
ncbi:MAG: carboxypeptidase-like regulatory domain-containing protein [Terriglobia bacterium]